MAFFDLSREELENYCPDIPEPDDFDAFWEQTLEANPFDPSSIIISQVDSPLTMAIVYDVTFGGYANDPIRAWLVLPAGTTQPLPTIVEYIGMGGGRGLHYERLLWASAGYAHFIMDTRGQGAGWGHGGDTPDPEGTGPTCGDYMTRGIQSRDTYFYHRLYIDAHHAVEAAASLPMVDQSRIAVTGTSQGGASAIAAAALNPRVIAAMPDVPFMCHMRRAIGLTDASPFADVVHYLAVQRDDVDAVWTTLSYFDAASLARRASVPALFSTALMDDICPPSTVFAARNLWGQATEACGEASRPQIVVYSYNRHEGGQLYQWREQVAWLGRLLDRDRA